ncbi:glycosyltransferase family 39 protein [Candidatus Woesearchaeota archaeon]|nr:glycosyltransferase family 39 protein [Candidatus Woesearchaeota archaeon]
MDKNKLPYVFLAAFMAAFLAITLRGLSTAQPGDENVYYYMGRLVSEGKIPYRDFFFAHPPLQIYLIALVYKAFGFNIAALKSVSLISALITAFFVFKIAKEKFGSSEAIISSLLLLFSYSVIFNSVFSFGIEIAMMFLIIGTYFLFNRSNYVLAGIFFGIAGITRLLSLVPIFIVFCIVFLSDKKSFLRLSSAFLIVFLAVNGIFALFLKDAYLSPVYKFHLLKSFGGGENFKEYFDIVKLNWILFFSAFLFIFIKGKKAVNLFFAVSVIYLIFLFSLKKIFGFYFIVIFPFLAIAGGYSIASVLKNIQNKKLAISASLILSIVFVWNLAADVAFLEKIGFRGFERGSDLADFVNSHSDENTMLFGDDSVVPLLALLTNKKIAFDFVDTNNEVFLSGLADLNEILNRLKNNDVLFIIRSKQGISYFKEVRQFLNKNCDLLSQFHDKTEGAYLVYRCN